tara:strand:+ start:231 stop:440 length:210 start_codon:yes stop_codon:yes gene_type:complete
MSWLEKYQGKDFTKKEFSMNSRTRRNRKKSTQLKHTKEKLHEMKHDRSNKKNNLVKSLKNLMKRARRKG